MRRERRLRARRGPGERGRATLLGPGDRARWVYVVQHGDTGWRFHYQYLESPWVRGPWNDEKLWHPHHPGQAAYIVPPIANFINGPSGLTYYPGTGLTSAYDGHFFLCEFRGNAKHSGVMAFDLIPQGASFSMTGSSVVVT